MTTNEDADHATLAEGPLGGAPGSLRVLVVENHADTRLSLAMLLEQLGHSVVCAETMEEALAALLETDCDLLISDIGLPDGDGWELLRRAAPRPAYAVAMSGYGMNTDLEKSRVAGYRHHLVKPMALDQLEDVLAEAVRELHPG